MSGPSAASLHWREMPEPQDVSAVRALVHATGFFSCEEIGVAAELVDERLKRGDASGYEFVLCEGTAEGTEARRHGGTEGSQGEARRCLAGYACFGRIAFTEQSFDLYWIVVDPWHQSRGLGRALLERVLDSLRARGGGRLYAETSSREQYAPTRTFYERTGFTQAAFFPDFYAKGDGKVVYVREA